MKDSHDTHAPTPEFAAFLARDIARTFRHDTRFAPSARAQQARRIGIVVVSVIGTIAVLATGLVFGTNTGYASARVENDRRHDEIAATTLGVAGQLATLRLDLERARATLTLRAADRSTPSPAVLQAAADELRMMSATVERIALDLTQNRTPASQVRSVATRNIPVKEALAASLTALVSVETIDPQPQSVPTIDLPASTAKTTEALWSVHGVRQLAGGMLLVNNATGREVRMFDSTLTSSTVALDSNAYGTRRPRGTPLIMYRGDSSLLADPRSRTIRVLDPRGRIARTVPLPDVQVNLSGAGYADDKGRVLFAGNPDWSSQAAIDSVPIVRIDLGSGRVDTVARIKNPDRPAAGPRYTRAAARDTGIQLGFAVTVDGARAQPLVPSRDDWSVLSDGSIALIRGHDYHIDWIRPDGSTRSTAKLPFDWQRLTDERSKTADDAAHALAQAAYTLRLAGDSSRRIVRRDSGMIALRGRLDSAVIGDLRLYDFITTLTIGTTNASATALADQDGNVWILPTSPAADSAAVYDVVNGNGVLVRRVRVPATHTIAGFGKGGVVYLSSGNRSDGYHIERTKLR